MNFNRILIFIMISMIWGCSKDEETPLEIIPEFAYSGGATTIFDASSHAFATPAPNLSLASFDKHLAGDLAFEQVFVTAPAVVNPGLGPVFNNNSCVSCHVRNGRSRPAMNGDELSGFLIRLSVPGTDPHGGPKPVPYYGTQLQTRAIYGQEREAGFAPQQIEKIVTFLDGTSQTLMRNEYVITDQYAPMPADLMTSPRVAPAVFGLGLLEAIPEQSLLAIADENDSDGDGISGKPNYVWNVETQEMSLGRFGWKALHPTAIQQTADAFHQDMGITNSLFKGESCLDQSNCPDTDNEIDIDDEALDVTAFYFQSLATPGMRNYNDEKVLAGKQLFSELKCGSCHTPKHITGAAVIPELENQTIYPYTDLLLHDMGEGLADNRPSFDATGREWRTPPLWGLGLLPVVNGHSRLLHDGRARTIEEAILWHGGEAATSQRAYTELTPTERAQLLAFLKAI